MPLTLQLVFRAVGFHGADIRNLVNEAAIKSETAISVFYSREDMIDQGYTTFGYLKMQMAVAHGGRCAERLVHGEDVTDGGEITREMAISPMVSSA
ncbi:hypothetical protein NC653_020684 [Populus alba x Populus x berolinensis]|uniref:Uncharacterized protein n=1 Tax=Populus alba x Populus x berolinensis TaxID=444605 RepID=A0AAD6ML25_9ROSI|nr:hypothetical protein NC653_020684 [Populus alba x Populus x berolinensis]